MTYCAQPQIYYSVPVTIAHVSYSGGLLAYQTIVGNETYVWTKRTTPAGNTEWISTVSTSVPEKAEVVPFDIIPTELYKAIKDFYVGEPQKVYRG
jgi:hypothetical protein